MKNDGIIKISDIDIISERQYLGDKSIKELYIDGSVKQINAKAFSGCENLEKVVFGEGFEAIGEKAFSNCKKLKNVIFPATLKYVGRAAFINCRNLSSITLPEGLTEIPDACFNYCENLETVQLPLELKYIRKLAFANSGLKKIEIPSSVEIIEDDSFSSCENLEHVIFNNEKKFFTGAFSYCHKLNIDEISEHINKWNIDGNRLLGYVPSDDDFEVIIPEGISKIEENAFAKAKWIKKNSIPFFFKNYRKRSIFSFYIFGRSCYIRRH